MTVESTDVVRRARVFAALGDPARLRLVTATLPSIRPRGAVVADRVVFVCTANSARSQLAAALWSTVSDVPVSSGGTHPARRVAPGAVRAARRRACR